MSAFVIRVVACTIGAVMSLGCTPALASSWVTPARTPLSGRDGVDSVLSTTTRPLSASRSTTSVKVPPMSTASRQSAIAVLLPDGMEDVHDPDRSEEHTSELQSLMRISYAVFCLKKKKKEMRTKYEKNEATLYTKTHI